MGAQKQRKLLPAGTAAPDFRLARLEGGQVAEGEASLAELLAGGPVLLVFFKITCPVCQMTLPFLERLHAAGATRVFGISQNDAHDTRQFLRHFGLSFPMLLDSEDDGFPASNDYGISSVPTMYRIDPNGTIDEVIEGWLKTDMERLGALRPDDNVPAWKAG
jgi:peroxiredoxin